MPPIYCAATALKVALVASAVADGESIHVGHKSDPRSIAGVAWVGCRRGAAVHRARQKLFLAQRTSVGKKVPLGPKLFLEFRDATIAGKIVLPLKLGDGDELARAWDANNRVDVMVGVAVGRGSAHLLPKEVRVRPGMLFDQSSNLLRERASDLCFGNIITGSSSVVGL